MNNEVLNWTIENIDVVLVGVYLHACEEHPDAIVRVSR